MNKENTQAKTENSTYNSGKAGHMCGYHRHYGLRLLLGVIILLVVFAIGVKVGELKSHFGRSRGGYMMMGHYPNPMMRAYPMGTGTTYRRLPGSMLPTTATSTPLK